MFTITYKNHLTITLDSDNIVQSIECKLPILGSGVNRIVYDLGNNKVLKVAKTINDSLINKHEIKLYNEIKDKNCCVRFNTIYKHDENYMWYVAEKINILFDAMKEVLEIIPCIDVSDNAGYDQNGQLIVIDADRLHWTWFVKSENPYFKE